MRKWWTFQQVNLNSVCHEGPFIHPYINVISNHCPMLDKTWQTHIKTSTENEKLKWFPQKRLQILFNIPHNALLFTCTVIFFFHVYWKEMFLYSPCWKKYILESWPLAGSFQATARPQCSVKNIQELYPTKNWQNHYKTIIIQRQKTPQRTQNKGNLLRGKKGNIILVQMKWVCCHFTKLLQDIKNITYKKKLSPINIAWHRWPTAIAKSSTKDSVHCQVLVRHNWFQFFKGHFPIFIILTVNASSSIQLPSKFFGDGFNHNRLLV